jgi:hypothetical protein
VVFRPKQETATLAVVCHRKTIQVYLGVCFWQAHGQDIQIIVKETIAI